MRAGIAALTALSWVASACGSANLCRVPTDCAGDFVCHPNGRCGDLAQGGPIRFAATRWSLPAAWATSGGAGDEGLGPMDVLELGGDAEGVAYLAFRVPARRVLRAWLRISTSAGGVSDDASLIVFRVGTFDEGHLSRASIPTRWGRAEASALLPRGPSRAALVDVTRFVRRAQREGTSVLRLALTTEGSTSLRLASPGAAESSLRPRLELSVR